MNIAVPFILGFATSFLGTIFPSMLNMTAVKTSLDKNNTEAVRFALGVSIVVLAQAYLAILFAKYLHNNPAFIQNIQIIGAGILAILSVYFFMQSKKERRYREKEHVSNSFMFGVVLSSLNIFAIPFFCEITSVLGMFGWLRFENASTATFVLGSAIGTFCLLNMYIMYAHKIKNRSQRVVKDLNIVLAGLTGVLAIFTMLNAFF
ncbi:LysE family transporter [Flavobacteriaceae bacterium S356]|uniref:LysE family transporter n=1 Tax=Asprobacillus argus TaxID=3076534 RepID=A0ABU3LCM4_9FLAO|nr:LysE family transporter [Flavobacteriaceae bacterium S356]